MLLRLYCLVTLTGMLLNPLLVRSATEETEKPVPVKPDDPDKSAEASKGFFPAPTNFTPPDWALTPAGVRPGFDQKDSMGSFAFPGSDSSQYYKCAVAAHAAKLGVSTEALKTYMIQQSQREQAIQQYMMQRAMTNMIRDASFVTVRTPQNMRAQLGATMMMVRLGNPNDCFVAETPVALASERATIDQVTVGSRLSADTSAQASAIDAKSWRRVELRSVQADGRRTDITLLRSLTWLEANDVKVGAAVALNVPGYHVESPFAVRAIEACPTLQAGQGPVVTGTFRHESASVVDLFIDGQVESIGSTAGHRYFSADRQQFVAANQLKTGEQLSTPNGNVTVLRVVARQVDEPVYNLEVQGQATLRVGPAAVRAQSVGK